jgi:hypothetical protein
MKKLGITDSNEHQLDSISAGGHQWAALSEKYFNTPTSTNCNKNSENFMFK